MIRDLWQFALLALLAFGVGLVSNVARKGPLPLLYLAKSERLQQAVDHLGNEAPRNEQGSAVQEISQEEFLEMTNGADALILDTRPAVFHQLGHIPAALALPREEFALFYERHRALLERDKARTLLLYCGGGACEDSKLVAEGLRQLGYTNLHIYSGGWNEWREKGLPEER